MVLLSGMSAYADEPGNGLVDRRCHGRSISREFQPPLVTCSFSHGSMQVIHPLPSSQGQTASNGYFWPLTVHTQRGHSEKIGTSDFLVPADRHRRQAIIAEDVSRACHPQAGSLHPFIPSVVCNGRKKNLRDGINSDPSFRMCNACATHT